VAAASGTESDGDPSDQGGKDSFGNQDQPIAPRGFAPSIGSNASHSGCPGDKPVKDAPRDQGEDGSTFHDCFICEMVPFTYTGITTDIQPFLLTISLALV